MKLKDTFMTSDTVDFLMGQPNGANYVVLYQMLCLKTINTGGKLSRQIGEILIPYDEQKIARDTKWFTVDTVRVALELYKALGLIYQDVDGNLVLVDHENLVGSETDYAERNRRLRANNREALPEHNVYSDECNDVSQNVSIDIRDKDIKILDIRDKEINNNTPPKSPSRGKGVFVPPTLEEVEAYCKERNSNVDPKQFWEYFDAGDWVDSKGQKVRSWKQKLITWEKGGYGSAGAGKQSGTSGSTPKVQGKYDGVNFYDNV